MKKKPFKETKVGKFLASKGFDTVLETVGHIVPGVAILDQVKDMVVGPGAKHVLTPEDQAEFLQLLDIEKQMLQLALADTANARNRQLEMLKAGKSDWIHAVVTLFFLACFALVLIVDLFYPNPATSAYEETMKNIVLIMVGFYFGSSRGSRMKDLFRKGADE